MRFAATIVGTIKSLSSSTTPAASSERTTEMLACTPISRPGVPVSFRTNPTRSPSILVAFAQAWSRGVDVATNLSTVLMKSANGSIRLVGQNLAHWS